MSDLTRVMSVRLPEALAAQLDVVAQILGIPTSEAIRIALAAYVAEMRANPAIREGLRRRIEETQRMLGKD